VEILCLTTGMCLEKKVNFKSSTWLIRELAKGAGKLAAKELSSV